VIVRCWKGIATTDNAKKYIEHLDRSIMPILRTLQLCRDLNVLK
jgi:hypothetical protein